MRLDDRVGSLCGECGAAVSGGESGCRALFEEVIAREFGDFRYGRLHRLTVDTYSLQHPRRYMRSGKSFAAHLTGMWAALESDRTAAVNRAVRRWLDGPTDVERPGVPPAGRRGRLTVLHLREAADADDHVTRVREWARSTWAAWHAYHDLAKTWVEAVEERMAGEVPGAG